MTDVDHAPGPISDPMSSREKILYRLKTEGPLTAAHLSDFLEISVMAVHQHLRNLQEEQLIFFKDRRGKVGRPSRHWELAPGSVTHFPDYHRELAVGLVNAVRKHCGSDVLLTVIEDARQVMLSSLKGLVPGPEVPLRDRVDALVAGRGAGFMARREETPDGALHLVQYHCPIQEAAVGCLELCQAECDAIESLFGGSVTVEQKERITAGDRRCSFEIRARTAGSSSV